MKRYTKAQLEELVCAQYENLNAMHDLLNIMKLQSELLKSANKKLATEINGVNEKIKAYPIGKKARNRKATQMNESG